MQEQIDRESIGIALKSASLTEKTLGRALRQVLGQIKKEYHNIQVPRGKQSLRHLMNHNVATNTIPLVGDTGLFDKVARKWNIDYAFHQTGENKYLLLFKSSQADAVTAAFAEYSSLVVKREKDKRPRATEQVRKAEEKTRDQKRKSKEHKREREIVRE